MNEEQFIAIKTYIDDENKRNNSSVDGGILFLRNKTTEGYILVSHDEKMATPVEFYEKDFINTLHTFDAQKKFYRELFPNG